MAIHLHVFKETIKLGVFQHKKYYDCEPGAIQVFEVGPLTSQLNL